MEMVEITHGGTWFKWSSMDSRDRLLFLLSTAASIPAGIVVALYFSRYAYQLGYRHGSGGKEGPDRLGPLVESDLFRYGVILAFVLLVVSIVAWWRFSLRQDELFNRIQNYALGRAGAWTVAIVSCWWILSLGEWIAPLPLEGVVIGGYCLIIGFWFRAVRLCT
jgi:hypothetical protein